MTDLPIRKVLQKPNVAGRMVRWGVELSEFDVQYEPRGPIKARYMRTVWWSSPRWMHSKRRKPTSDGCSSWMDPPTNKVVELA